MKDGIKSMAEVYYRSGYFRTYVRDILAKNKITKDDEEKLIQFCLECQKQQMSNRGQGMTIKEMKNTILNIIGRPDLTDRGYGQSTVGRKELRAILDFVMQLPAEYIADRAQDPVEDE